MRKLSIIELNRLSPEQYRESGKHPVVIVLDNVRSLNNVGAIFRTADAFRFEAVWLCGITAVPPHPEIHKTALGAEDTVEWRYFADASEAVRQLKTAGYTLCAVEQAEGSLPLNTFASSSDKKYALVLGHEVKGVRQEVIDECDCCLEIPQFGTKHSLNVSVAAGIVLWDLAKVYMKGQ